MRQILILGLSCAKAEPLGSRQTRPLINLWALRLLIKFLRFCHCEFRTVAAAMAAPTGRFACLTFDQADDDLAIALHPFLQARGVPATVCVTTAGRAQWEQLQRLAGHGWEIGCSAHALTDLTRLGASEQRRLIAKARDDLQQGLGVRPTLFAYPFGAYDASTVSCLKSLGFQAALTLRPGINGEAGEDAAFHLRRLMLCGNFWKDAANIWRNLRAADRVPTSAGKAALAASPAFHLTI